MGKPFFETHQLYVMSSFLNVACNLMVYSKSELMIPSNSFNDYSITLDLSHFPLIEKVVIGDNSFMNTPSLVFGDMALLKNVTIGRNSFYHTTEIIFRSESDS